MIYKIFGVLLYGAAHWISHMFSRASQYLKGRCGMRKKSFHEEATVFDRLRANGNIMIMNWVNVRRFYDVPVSLRFDFFISSGISILSPASSKMTRQRDI